MTDIGQGDRKHIRPSFLVAVILIIGAIVLLRLFLFPHIRDTEYELPYLLFVLVGSFTALWFGVRIRQDTSGQTKMSNTPSQPIAGKPGSG